METKETRKVRMQLVGLDGNAFNLLGHFKQKARQQGWTHEEIQAVIDEATRSDYDHLLMTLMKHTEA